MNKVWWRRDILTWGSMLMAVMPFTLGILANDGVAQETRASKSSGQESTGDDKAQVESKPEKGKESTQPPRALEISDVADWQRVSGMTLSEDTKWYGYALMPNEGDGQLFLKRREDGKTHEFKVGPGSGGIEFSHDGVWAAFRSAALDKDAKAAARRKEPAASKIILVNLADGEQTEFESIQRFAFSSENPRWLALQKRRPKERPSGDKGWKGTDLLLRDLKSDVMLNFGNVSEFGFNKSGRWLSMTIDAEHQTGNGLVLLDVDASRLKTLDTDKAEYRSLSWTREGDALTVLKGVKSDDYEKKLYELMGYRDFDGGEPQLLHVVPDEDAGIPESMTISPNRSPQWTDDRSGLVFGIHDAEKKEKKEDDADKSSKEAGADEEAGVVVWHWQDKRLQSQQQVQEGQDKNFSYLCVRQVGSDKTLQLATEEMRNASVPRPHRIAIATDNDDYQRAGSLDGRRYRDVYVIDIATGKRRLALEKYRWMTVPSPTGDQLLYYADKHFHVLDVKTGKSKNITKQVKTSFVDTEDDHNVIDPPRSPLGWSQDGRSVLLFDGWDMWNVPVEGGKAVNLTVNGRKDKIRYLQRYSLDPDEIGIDLGQPLYISMYGERNKKSGFGRISPGKPGVEVLVWTDHRYSGLSKAEDHDFFTFIRESESESRDYFATDAAFESPAQLTESNLQQKHFFWSSGARLVDYRSTNGDELQAALFLPANHIEGKKYPTVVYIYEKLSQRLHQYDGPRVGGFSPAIYTSQGYAVLMPDIVYQVNDPGGSSVACVLPALDAAIATGVVDGEHVGLHGHSWGGYQTSFLITQTDRFKAAVAGAPLTNMISMYSSIYWNSGSANQPIFESSQGRFTGGYWENIEAYTKNSPVYFAEEVQTPLLLLHNDEDGAVDWNQGIEYFNTLRRLDKPVVMLQYTGENHGVRKLPNRKDYSYRMLQFFDHYLKEKSAPEWWSEGVKHLEMKDHIRTLREERESQKNAKE